MIQLYMLCKKCSGVGFYGEPEEQPIGPRKTPQCPDCKTEGYVPVPKLLYDIHEVGENVKALLTILA